MADAYYKLEREDGGVSVMFLPDGSNIDREVAEWEKSGGFKLVRKTKISAAAAVTEKAAMRARFVQPQISPGE